MHRFIVNKWYVIVDALVENTLARCNQTKRVFKNKMITDPSDDFYALINDHNKTGRRKR